MACREHEKIIAFDTLFSTNHIQMLKVILPFMDNQMQKFMAIYIKFLELQYTIDFCKKHPFSLCGCVKQESPPDISGLCSELLPFCNDREKRQFEQMRNIFQSMEMYKEMSKTMETMKDFMPDMSEMFQNMQAASADVPIKEDAGSSPVSGTPFPAFNMTDMLMNMMTPEQKEMYEMFKGDNNNAE